MNKKLIIFGCNGFVGTSLTLQARRDGWEVYGADMAEQPVISDLQYFSVDITDRNEVIRIMEDLRPDYTVNVAAIANIDFAEANKHIAHSVNVEGAENIAVACSRIGSRYLFFSSDAVFDGITGGYTETSQRAYVNYYGETKAEAEDRVLKENRNTVVIRISLVLGFSPARGNSFMDSAAVKLAEGKTIECPESDIRTPIDIVTLCKCVLELYETDYRGVIHLGSTESGSRYQITKYAAELMGYPTELVLSRDFTDPEKAPRHKKGIISVALAQSILKTPLYGLYETVENAVRSRDRLGE